MLKRLGKLDPLEDYPNCFIYNEVAKTGFLVSLETREIREIL